MTTEQTTALATREFTDKQIRTRLEAGAATPGFGIFGASRELLNMVYLLARHYDVDPAVDITLHHDRPWFTIDGRVRLMKRHPQYRGYKTRPLSKDEKEAWGYGPDEIVVECTVRTRDWGEITARGKVSPTEFGRQPVAKSHPQEMAEKRAIARASRMAFGQDVPDDEEIENAVATVIEQRNDPQRVALNAARYTEVFGSDDDGTAYADMPAADSVLLTRNPPAQPPTSAPRRAQPAVDRSDTAPVLAGMSAVVCASGAVSDGPTEMVTDKADPRWQEWLAAERLARRVGVEYDSKYVTLPIAASALREAVDSLVDQAHDAAPDSATED
jgi:hypothetical protein